MINIEEARQLAKNKVSELFKCNVADEKQTVLLYDEPTMEGSFGWVFSYQSKKYMRTGNILDALVGGGPILIDRNTADVFVLGSGMPAEHYVQNHIKYGNPYLRPGRKIKLLELRENYQKPIAIRAVRDVVGISLAEAKSAIDSFINGDQINFECRHEYDAEALVFRLDEAGFKATQIPE